MIEKAARLAAKIKERSGREVQLIQGKSGELTVTYDGEIIANQEEKFIPQKKILAIILNREEKK